MKNALGDTPRVFAKSRQEIEKEGDGVRSFAAERKRVKQEG
jgi:hypothetical protein